MLRVQDPLGEIVIVVEDGEIAKRLAGQGRSRTRCSIDHPQDNENPEGDHRSNNLIFGQGRNKQAGRQERPSQKKSPPSSRPAEVARGGAGSLRKYRSRELNMVGTNITRSNTTRAANLHPKSAAGGSKEKSKEVRSSPAFFLRPRHPSSSPVPGTREGCSRR